MVLSFALLLLFNDDPEQAVDQALRQFTQVYSAIAENAAEPVASGSLLYEGAIPGLLKQLDPHSVFFDPGQFEQLKELESSTRKGFGTVVSLLPGRVIVLQTLPGTPSAKAGMMPGDEILAINGIPLNRLVVDQLVALLTQARQQPARLDVRRGGESGLLQIQLTPEDLDAPSVERAFSLRPGIGYLRVSSFDVNTGQLIQESIEKLGGQGLKGLVLDLRNNPGGVMNAALETAGMFLRSGQIIMSVKGRSAKAASEAKVPEGAKPYEFPVVVLLNRKSASGSEIVAGALQDHGRAKVLGERSFGKGLVQSVFPLSQGTGLALTVAFYYTPEGKSIQKPLPGLLKQATMEGSGGIEPDQTVLPDPVSQLRAVLEASGSFTTFATSYLKEAKPLIDETWTVPNRVLDEFQAFLSARNIRPSIADWSREREWIRGRLQQDLFNLSLGVAEGDRIELEHDPVIKAALEALGAG